MKRLPWLLFAVLAIPLASCGGGDTKAAGSAGASDGAPAKAAGGVAAVSRYDDGPRAAESPVNKEMAEQGEELFKNKGCSACHGFGQRLTGPDLAGVSTRRTTAWIENQILHPDLMVKEDPIARKLFAEFALQMPKQGLTPEEAQSIIEYFKHRDHEAGLAGAHK